uniref:CRAL-TRIO domain-containing protein n=1 Tax=Angiostrongylus cantonensis TaxID=6313 RepID=A0A0K0D365_ANGCA
LNTWLARDLFKLRYLHENLSQMVYMLKSYIDATTFVSFSYLKACRRMNIYTPADGLFQTHVTWEDIETDMQREFDTDASFGQNKIAKDIGDGNVSKAGPYTFDLH